MSAARFSLPDHFASGAIKSSEQGWSAVWQVEANDISALLHKERIGRDLVAIRLPQSGDSSGDRAGG